MLHEALIALHRLRVRIIWADFWNRIVATDDAKNLFGSAQRYGDFIRNVVPQAGGVAENSGASTSPPPSAMDFPTLDAGSRSRCIVWSTTPRQSS